MFEALDSVIPPTRPSDKPLRLPLQDMGRSVVLELCQSAESRPVSSNLVWLSPSPQSTSPLKSSLLRCTTNLSKRLAQVITLVSTSRTFPSRTSVVETSHRTPKMTPLKRPKLSPPRSL